MRSINVKLKGGNYLCRVRLFLIRCMQDYRSILLYNSLAIIIMIAMTRRMLQSACLVVGADIAENEPNLAKMLTSES